MIAAVARNFLFKPPIPETVIVQQLKSLNRWETASFTAEKIIDKSTDQKGLKHLLFGDRVLLIAYGEVIAGYDLAKMKPDYVQIQKDTVSVHLPVTEILVSRIDNTKTRVYDRRQGLLTKGDVDLEAQARSEAESVIRKAACDAGIFKKAEDNARKQLTTLLSKYGFNKIEILTFPSSCK